MKKYAATLATGLFLVACGSGEAEDQELIVQSTEEAVETVEDSGDVHFYLFDEEETISEGDSFQVALDNQTDDMIETGRSYIVEFFDDGEWEEIVLPLAFTDDLVVVEPDDSFIFEVHLLPEDEEGTVEEYESGSYRIVKDFSPSPYNPGAYEIMVEFELEAQ